MRFWRRFLIGLMALVICFIVPASTYAASGKISEEDLYFYGQNGIYFYMPGAKTCFGTLMGSTVYEKVLSGLMGMGLNEVAAAGVYSNLMAEGFGSGGLLIHEYGVNSRATIGTWYTAATYYGPNGLLVKEEDVRDLYNPEIMHGIGPAGWSFGLRVLLLETLRDYGVEKYATEWDDVKGVYVYDGLSYDQMSEQFGEAEADTVLVAVLNFFDKLYIKNEYDGYKFVATQGDIDAQGLSKYGITAGMPLVDALNLVETPYEASELFFTTGEMPGFTRFDERQSVHASRADEGLELIHSAGLTASGAINCSNNQSIVDTAIDLAWDGFKENSASDLKPEYEMAMKQVGTFIDLSNGMGSSAPYGASCDIFVSTVMRYSGSDPDFVDWGPERQMAYMESRTDLYEEIENLEDASNLQPGDIFVIAVDGHPEMRHIFIFMGIVDGKWMQASASFGERTGCYYEYEEYRVAGYNNEKYRIFRRV